MPLMWETSEKLSSNKSSQLPMKLISWKLVLYHHKKWLQIPCVIRKKKHKNTKLALYPVSRTISKIKLYLLVVFMNDDIVVGVCFMKFMNFKSYFLCTIPLILKSKSASNKLFPLYSKFSILLVSDIIKQSFLHIFKMTSIFFQGNTK